jgi:hypothetical protein
MLSTGVQTESVLEAEARTRRYECGATEEIKGRIKVMVDFHQQPVGSEEEHPPQETDFTKQYL